MRILDPDITTNITGPGVPSVGQVWFSRQLEWVTKYRLAWHRRRKVFVVYLQRSKGSNIITHPCELSNRHFPLSRKVLQLTVDAIRMSEAARSMDFRRQLAEMKRIDRDNELTEYFRHADDIMPEVTSLARHIMRTCESPKSRRKHALVN